MKDGINGKLNEYNNPWIVQRADPYVYRHTDGSYYFTATVPEYDRIILRHANSLAGLALAEEKVIWNKHTSGVMGAHIWAPELHYYDGEWYIYFAAGDAENVWEIRPYVLKCEGQNPSWDLCKVQMRMNFPFKAFHWMRLFLRPWGDTILYGQRRQEWEEGSLISILHRWKVR